MAIFAVAGSYIGGSAAEGWEFNPGNWAWDGDTWKGIGLGAVIGAAGGIGFGYGAPALAQTGFFAHFQTSGMIAAHAITGAAAGGVVGYGAGFSGGMVYSNGDWGYSHQSGLFGAQIGTIGGSMIGTAYGLLSPEGRDWIAGMFAAPPTIDIPLPELNSELYPAAQRGDGPPNLFGSSPYGFSRRPIGLETKVPERYFYGVPIYESSIYNNGSAITLPPRGIWVGEGVANSKNIRDIMTLRHEYGHWLQYKEYGLGYYYRVIGPTSFFSAWRSSSSYEHMHTWTEQDANRKAYIFFGQPSNWLFNLYPIFFFKGRLPKF